MSNKCEMVKAAVALGLLYVLRPRPSAVGAVYKEKIQDWYPCSDGHWSDHNRRGACNWHGGLKVNQLPETELVELVHYPGAGITPNKNVKANISRAIEDVLSTWAYNGRIKPMAAGMLFNAFKDDLNVIVEADKDLQPLQYNMFKKMAEDGWVEVTIESESDRINWNTDWLGYTITDKGIMLVEKIAARLQSLRHLKSGSDMFPDYTGISGLWGL